MYSAIALQLYVVKGYMTHFSETCELYRVIQVSEKKNLRCRSSKTV